MQRTLILLKPDCLDKRVAGQVLSRFEEKDYTIIASKMIQLDQQLLVEHYAHVADLPFFPKLQGFMSSRPVLPRSRRRERDQKSAIYLDRPILLLPPAPSEVTWVRIG